MSQMTTTPLAQSMATELIAHILAHNEAGLRELIAPDITLTAVLNGGAPWERHGEEAYLDTIRDIWERVINYKYTAFWYDQFTNESGVLHFTQVVIGKEETGDKTFLSEGTQTFTVTNRRISAISVVETKQVLSESEERALLIQCQAPKIMVADRGSSLSLVNRDCILL